MEISAEKSNGDFGSNAGKILGAINVLTGLFSSWSGFRKVSADFQIANILDTSSPWLYVIFGLVTVVVGLGNFNGFFSAGLASGIMILASFYNAWFGAAFHDWRFWTLNSYVAVCGILLAIHVFSKRYAGQVDEGIY